MWCQAVECLCRQRSYTVESACRLLDRTKQAYYKKRRTEGEWIYRANHMIDVANEIRYQDPGIGCYKLWLMTRRMFGQRAVPGRDAFFDIMRMNGMTLQRPRPRRTTNSNHRYHKYKNLIKGFVPSAPNRLWVSDITYIETAGGFCYLHLVTDAYSHKIIGWWLSETLHSEHTLRALRMAMESAGENSLEGLIHHSDRGVQYCCDEYVAALNKAHIQISMTEDYKPTDNAIAERVNGILKTEVIYRENHFRDYDDAKARISEYVTFYNERRPHGSVGMKTPAQAHLEEGPQKKLWKNKVYKKGNPVNECSMMSTFSAQKSTNPV